MEGHGKKGAHPVGRANGRVGNVQDSPDTGEAVCRELPVSPADR